MPEAPQGFPDFFKMMMTAKADAAKAHAHAAEFGQSLRDEKESAQRVGACMNCLSSEAIQFAAELVVEVNNGADPETIIKGLPAIGEMFQGFVVRALLNKIARKMAEEEAAKAEIKT